MILNNKQKKYLNGLGQKLSAVVIIGKDGVSEHIINNLDDALTAHELVKVSILKMSDADVNETAIDLASQTKSEVVTKIGRVIVLYRASKKQLIRLPK